MFSTAPPALGQVQNDTPPDLLKHLTRARQRIKRADYLLRWSEQIRELLHMGVLDADGARALVDDFKKQCAIWRSWRRP